MHIGLVQIAFRPLTLKGLPETFLAALRDARNLNFRKSLMDLLNLLLHIVLYILILSQIYNYL